MDVSASIIEAASFEEAPSSVGTHTVSIWRLMLDALLQKHETVSATSSFIGGLSAPHSCTLS